ncbi:MAG: hypothetical protein IKP40_12855 [Clostridia bacterium]|nr:hypothetical protein [Clostridia bacterium]
MSTKKRILRLIGLAVLLALTAVLLCSCAQQSAGTQQTQTASDQKRESRQVTLNPAGGAWADGSTEPVTISVEEGTPIDFAAYTPVLEGNDLLGWYMQDGYPWPGARKVSGDISLRAKWSATEVEVSYDLALTINGEKEALEYENGVYQFTHVSSIYGGYAQRAGKYTIYEADLKNAIAADDGSVQRVLYHAGSNYIDATGIIYAEFYNDGEFELYYDYVNAGQRTKYCMNTGYWTLVGYTPPFEATPIPVDETGMGYISAHLDWDKTLTGEEEPAAEEETAEAPAEEKTPDIITVPGATIYTADATASETMKANFCDNGVMAVYMTSYGVNVDAKYLWAFAEDGSLSLTYNGGEENILRAAEDGSLVFDDNYGNTYQVDAEALRAAVKEPVKIYTASAVNSATMFVFFYDNHTCTVNFDLTSFGQAGQFYVTASGQWRVGENSVELVIDGAPVEITAEIDPQHPENNVITFPVAENTYRLSPLFYMSGQDNTAAEEGEAK